MCQLTLTLVHANVISMIDTTLAALAEPRRRRILIELGAGELSAGEIAARFDVTRPAISQHLAVLRHAGLVAERRQGTRRLYRTRREGLEPLREWVDGFWAGSLDALKAAVEGDRARATKDSHG
jgi:DNA-binding transcriptional ArsR family regulator